MRSFKYLGIRPETVEEALRETYDFSALQQLCKSLIGGKPPTRKADLTAELLGLIEGDRLASVIENLTARQKDMVSQAAWSSDGVFNQDRFDARHGSTASNVKVDEVSQDGDQLKDRFGRNHRNEKRRTWPELLMPQGVVPRELEEGIRALLPEPGVPSIQAMRLPPESVDVPGHRWNAATKSYESFTESVPVELREMAPAALSDLPAVLRLIDAGKISVSEKNQTPKPSAIRAITDILYGGDFYPTVEKQVTPPGEWVDETAGPIRAFAWPMLLQAGKLARVKASRLELTPTGRSALLSPPAETLRSLWQSWVDSDLLDEFRRIDVIRGQTGNGKKYLSDVTVRRQAVAAAIAECPVGAWVSLDEFSRHMRAAGHEFEVTSDPWTLYIAEAQYGQLGYDGYHGWNILQMRYILCLVMEYAATLGIVDVAYIPPEGARHDYGKLWGTDDLSFFSRYDGLFHLRLTELGAFILEMRESFSPPKTAARAVIDIDDDLVVRANRPLPPADVLLLETFAEPAGQGKWRLDAGRILDAESAGRSIKELTAFLESAGNGTISGPVDEYLAEVSKRARALTDLGPARLVGCDDPSLALFISEHPETAKLCAMAGPDRLVVSKRHVAAFQRGVKKLGFALRLSTADG